MSITSKIYKYVRPDSVDDSNYEEFEYLLAWYGRDGSYLQKMFTDREEETRTNVTPINIKNKDKIKTFINSEERSVNLVAENLSWNDKEAIKSILVAPEIIRVYKTDGTLATATGDDFERVTIDASTYKCRKTDLRYNVEFTIILKEKPLAR